MKKDRRNEIWGVLFLLLGLFTLASLAFFHQGDISYYTSHPANPVKTATGIIGAYLSFGLFLTFGISAFVIPAIFLLWAWCYFLQNVPEKKMFKFFGLIIALFSASTIIAISVRPELRFENGGVIGYLVGSHLLRYFGYVGSLILAVSCLLLSILLATDFLIYPLIRNFWDKSSGSMSAVFEVFSGLREWVTERLEDMRSNTQEERTSQPKRKTVKKGKIQTADIAPKSVLPDIPLKVKRYRQELEEGDEEEKEQREEARKGLSKMLSKNSGQAKAKTQKPKPERAQENRDEEDRQEEEASEFEGIIGSENPEADSNYEMPPIDLLKKPEKPVISGDNLQENSRILESTLAEFGIEVKVSEVEQGPVITRYELLPAPGVKVNSIAALSDDIALALKARSVRLIIPIPGKSAVGVEVPNSVSEMVFVREIIDDQVFKNHKFTLPLALGKNTSGKTMISDLSAMPHLLIAGTTGSGKTVCVNSVIVGLLYSCKPSELKFIMIDPKMVELAVYNKIPHMLSPVVTDVRKAAHTLNWVVNEMERRYKLLATVGVRNIQSFNARELEEEDAEQVEKAEDSEHVIPAKLPYIMVVVDELADLMLVAQDKVETAITRLAQLSRAVGIHLLLATQRPSVDVITGVIKANFPARISFKVASKVDSRTVLDAIGADKLIGRGDMLFMRPGDEKPTRGQAALVVDEEINNVVEHVSKQGQPEYHEEIQQAQSGKAAGGAAQEKDELFDDAVDIVLETRQASTSNLQRRLRLGYTRAARIIDQMEAEGLIGPSQGAKPREIYMSSNPSDDEALVDENDYLEQDEEETVETE